MTLVLILISKLEIIDYISTKAYFLLYIQSSSLDHRYLSNLIISSIILTNTIVFRIWSTRLSSDIRRAKS